MKVHDSSLKASQISLLDSEVKFRAFPEETCARWMTSLVEKVDMTDSNDLAVLGHLLQPFLFHPFQMQNCHNKISIKWMYIRIIYMCTVYVYSDYPKISDDADGGGGGFIAAAGEGHATFPLQTKTTKMMKTN